MTAPRKHARMRVSDEIRDLILKEYLVGGALEPGDRLPTEAALCERYMASRSSVREALRGLKEMGYIAIRHGQGSTMLARPSAIASGLDELSSMESFAALQGVELTSRDVDIFEDSIDDSVADAMGQPRGTSVLVIQRLKLYNGKPVAWIVDYVPASTLPFEVMRSMFRGSVLDVLLAHDHLSVSHSDCEITATGTPDDVARRLDVREGEASVQLNEVVRSTDLSPISWSFAWLLPEAFRFSVRRRRVQG